jgi:hypothetical protein
MFTFNVNAVPFPPVLLAGIVKTAELFVPPNGDEIAVGVLSVKLYVIGANGPPVEQQFGPAGIPL